MAAVYCAWDAQLSRTVAIKRVRRDAVEGEAGHGAWQEAMRLASLHHPNIVTIHDFGIDEEGAFVVMEFVQGETVEALVARGPLEWDDFTKLAEQAVSGVIAAHNAGMIHRDLKPANLMVTWLAGGEFQLKILDFGLAKFTAATSSQTTAHDGSMFGSIYTMSPEQLAKREVDARSDLYALGCVFYYALTGYMPFNGETGVDVIASHLQHQVTPLETLRPDLSPAACAWVMQFIEFEPEHRFQSASQAAAALRHIRNAGQGNNNGAEGAAAAPRSRAPLWIIFGALVMLSLGVSLWALLRTAPETKATGGPTAAPVVNAAPMATPAALAAASPKAPVVPMRTAAGKVFDPHDLEGLRAHMGQSVTVEGVVAGMGKNKTMDFRYMDFDAHRHDAAEMVFYLDQGGHFSEETLGQYLNKHIRVTGVVDQYKDEVQIIVKNLGDIQIVAD